VVKVDILVYSSHVECDYLDFELNFALWISFKLNLALPVLVMLFDKVVHLVGRFELQTPALTTYEFDLCEEFSVYAYHRAAFYDEQRLSLTFKTQFNLIRLRVE